MICWWLSHPIKCFSSCPVIHLKTQWFRKSDFPIPWWPKILKQRAMVQTVQISEPPHEQAPLYTINSWGRKMTWKHRGVGLGWAKSYWTCRNYGKSTTSNRHFFLQMGHVHPVSATILSYQRIRFIDYRDISIINPITRFIGISTKFYRDTIDSHQQQ